MVQRVAPWLVVVLLIGALAAGRPGAAEGPDTDKGKKESPAAAKHDTVKVERGPLTAAVSLKGTVQGEVAAELALRPKTLAGPFVVRSAVEHGTAVRKGDVLVVFEAEKVEHQVRDARQERDLAALAIRQAELELPILEKQGALDLQAAERDALHAAEDLKRYLDVDLKLARQTAEMLLKSATFAVEFARDELKQLQKMYRDKDLTEETERMILKRYQFGLEMDEFSAVRAKASTDHALQTELPRREQAARDAAAKADVALARAREVAPLALKQKRLALAKLQYEEARAREKLAELEHDRAELTVVAPADGVAYHGRYVRGQWHIPQGGQGHALVRGGHVNPEEVFVTLLAPGRSTVRAEVEEKEAPGLTVGLAGRLAPASAPNERLAAKLARLAAAPLGGKFEATIEVDAKAAAALVPGTTCTVRFVTARKPGALTLPASAVFEDVAEDHHYVYTPGKGGKPQKKVVKTGPVAGDRVEIVEGLAEGDEVLSSKP